MIRFSLMMCLFSFAMLTGCSGPAEPTGMTEEEVSAHEQSAHEMSDYKGGVSKKKSGH